MGFSIRDKRLEAGPGDTVVAEETVEQGKNGKFESTLIKRKKGWYDLEVFMKLQFYFKNGNSADFSTPNAHIWTTRQKQSFMRSWRSLIRKAWNAKNIGSLKDGGVVNIVFNFYIQDAGWMWDHFEIDVTKIPLKAFAESYVDRAIIKGDVQLDSNDLRPKITGQLAAVHEFGHMIGLPDEYQKKSPHRTDLTSIMNEGTVVKARHYFNFLNWANVKR